MCCRCRAGLLLPALVCAVLFTSSARGGLIHFGSQSNGTILSSQYGNYQGGLTFSADDFQPGAPDLAIVMDTRIPSTADPDLNGPWDHGNIPADTDMGKVLILAENSVDANHDGLIDTPDDEGHRPAGTVTIRFKQPQG